MNMSGRSSLKPLFILVAVLMLGRLSVLSAEAGEWIAYSRLTDGFWQIWLMGPDGSYKAQLTFSPQDKREPVWINQGQQVLYRTNNGQLFVMDRDGKNERQLLAQMGQISNPTYCDRTNELFFVRFDRLDNSEIWKLDLTKTEEENGLFMLSAVRGLKYQPAVSPSGGRVVFIKAHQDKWSRQLWVTNIDGGDTGPLTAGPPVNDAEPVFSLDGKELLFASDRQGGNYEIYLLNLQTKTVNQLTSDPALDTSPGFSADGRKIVFVSNRSGRQQIWVMDRDELSAVPLTTEESESVDPAWYGVKK